METKRILITGADGLLGSNLTRELINRGHEITALVQPGRNPVTIEGLNIQKIEGDITDFDSLSKNCKDFDAIFHLAANTALWPYRSEFIRKINVEGTVNMLKLAKNLKVKKMVYVGTANSFTYGSLDNLGVEDTPYVCHKYGLDYMDSKREAQENVLKAAKEGLPVTVLNPTFMFGKFDTNPNSGAMIVAVHDQKIPGFAPGGKNYICVKDAVIAAANALTMGRNGECYILGNENLDFKTAFAKIGKVINVKPPTLIVPKPLLLLYGYLGTLIGKITGKAPTVSLAMVKISCDCHYYSSTKAVKELKMPLSPIEEGVKECYDWLKAQDRKYFAKEAK